MNVNQDHQLSSREYHDTQYIYYNEAVEDTCTRNRSMERAAESQLKVVPAGKDAIAGSGNPPEHQSQCTQESDSRQNGFAAESDIEVARSHYPDHQTQCTHDSDSRQNGFVAESELKVVRSHSPEHQTQCTHDSDSRQNGFVPESDNIVARSHSPEYQAKCTEGSDSHQNGFVPESDNIVARSHSPEHQTQCTHDSDSRPKGFVAESQNIVARSHSPEHQAKCTQGSDSRPKGFVAESQNIVARSHSPEYQAKCTQVSDSRPKGFVAESDIIMASSHSSEEQAPRTLTSDHPNTLDGHTKISSCYDNAPDGGWGWVVTFSAFMVGVILDGIAFCFGLFFNELRLEFDVSKSQTSWVISVLNGTYLGIGPFVSIFVRLFGYRRVAMFGATLASMSFLASTWSPNIQTMIVVYGLMGGAGLGLLYLPAIVSVGHYFTTKRALATGIAVCGSGIGGFVFAPLSEFLLELYGWKGAMWIIAAIVLNGIPIAAMLRPIEGSLGSELSHTPERTIHEDQNNDSATSVRSVILQRDKPDCCSVDIRSIFDFELLRSPTFLVYGTSCFLCMLGFYIPFTYIPDYVEGRGFTSQDSAILISIIGILNTISRILVGLLADRPWTDVIIINSFALIIGGAATTFVPYYYSWPILIVYCSVFGIAIAVFVSLRSIIMTELLGIEKLTSSFGLVTMCQGCSALIGAPIAGALSDIMGDYVGAFYLAGIAIGLSGAICFPLRRINAWERHRSSQSN